MSSCARVPVNLRDATHAHPACRGLRNAFVINFNWALVKASKHLLQRASVTSLVIVVVVLISVTVPWFKAGMLVSAAAGQRQWMNAALRRDP